MPPRGGERGLILLSRPCLCNVVDDAVVVVVDDGK